MKRAGPRGAELVRACLAAGLLALAGTAFAAPERPETSDARMTAPQRRAVFLLGPAAGYRLPLEPLTFGENERTRCLGCHGLPSFMARDSVTGEVLRLTVDGAAFGRSAHATLYCTQCHTDIHGFPHAFGGGRRPHVGCDADCHATDAKGKPVRHQDQMAECRAGVHRKGLEGDADQPGCAYCHGAGNPHGARPVKQEFTHEGKLELCASCHDDRDRMARGKRDGDASASYRRGFHYAALRLGEPRAAICEDCHDTHGVRASRDTAATTHASHLRATCGQKGCHPGAGARFAASGTDHATMRSHRASAAGRAGGWLAWIGGAIVALMALGVLLDLQRPLRAAAPAAEGALLPRLSLSMRLQHGVLVASFTLLALTGLPLRWPDLGAMQALSRAFGGWEGARAVHRVAGALMLLLALVHLAFAIVRLVRARFRAGEAWPLLPTWADAREAWETLLYDLRLRPAPPAHGRDEFRARLHYLAVLWGVPVMTLTGAVMWLAGPLGERLPRAALGVAAIAHGEEALIAVAIVLLWHFYNVHFAPGRGLRAWTAVDGRVTSRHQAVVHPRGTDTAPTRQG